MKNVGGLALGFLFLLNHAPARAACEPVGEEYMRVARFNLLQLKVVGAQSYRGKQLAQPLLTNLNKAVEMGNPEGFYELGYLYESGRLFPQDRGKAAEYYEKAAACNFKDAEFRLAVFHEQGVGYPKSYDEARRWYQRAADHGKAEACDSLGFYSLFAKGGPRDTEAAIFWYFRAYDLKTARSAVGPSGDERHSMYDAMAIRAHPEIQTVEQFRRESDRIRDKVLADGARAAAEMDQTMGPIRNYQLHCGRPQLNGRPGRSCGYGEVPH